jgi:hypothetical protein
MIERRADDLSRSDQSHGGQSMCGGVPVERPKHTGEGLEERGGVLGWQSVEDQEGSDQENDELQRDGVEIDGNV